MYKKVNLEIKSEIEKENIKIIINSLNNEWKKYSWIKGYIYIPLHIVKDIYIKEKK